MKKTYQNPQTKLIKVQMAQMVAASIQMYGDDATKSGMSREGGDFWDDEE